MAEKIKKISINAFEKAVKENYVPTTTVEWNGLEIVVRKHISLAEMIKFVDVCTKACFNDNAYFPEFKDFAFNSCIILFYTNLSLPENFEKQYTLIHMSGIIDTVIGIIDVDQLDEIVTAIDQKIAYINGSNISAFNKQATELFSAIESFKEQFASIFDGIGVDDVKKIIGAISEGSLDEEKLVRAYIGAKQE